MSSFERRTGLEGIADELNDLILQLAPDELVIKATDEQFRDFKGELEYLARILLMEAKRLDKLRRKQPQKTEEPAETTENRAEITE